MQDKYKTILNSSTVLLVEDDKKVQNSFAKLLNFYVKSVFVANDGIEALEIYEKNHPDIIITDVKMPRLNGIEFIKRIRQKDSKTPIVVTSAYTDQEYLLESIKLSLIEYLVKPMREEALEKVLTQCAKSLSNSKKEIYFNSEFFYDFTNKVFIYNDKTITLTNKEIEFIELLLAHRGNLVTKQKIEDKLYIYEDAPPSALKNLVFKLRKKLPLNIIKTQGKLGYLID
jgi:DNA-binding response OmpR family regulator